LLANAFQLASIPSSIFAAHGALHAPLELHHSHSWKEKTKEKHDKSPSKTHQAPSSKNKSPSGHTHDSTSQRSSSNKCFKCLGYKHIALNCPMKRTMILKKSDDESEHFSSPSPQSTSSHTYSSSIERTKPLESGLLMVRRQLGQVPKEIDPSQRQNLFHGGCLINDKICPFIIDSGSCVNMASLRVVEKFGLKTIPHAKSSLTFQLAILRMRYYVTLCLWKPTIFC